MYTIGVDIGGTSVKIGLVRDGTILHRMNFKTETDRSQEDCVAFLCEKISQFILDHDVKKESLAGIGICSPGLIDSQNGIVVYASNLNWKHLPLAEIVERSLRLPCRLINDASAATLTEWLYGAGKGCDQLLMLTLGTGVGSGLIVNGQLAEGNKRQGLQFGHTVIKINGRRCSCGRRGCLETYASAKALVSSAREEAKKHPDSSLFRKANGNLNEIDGLEIFEAAKKGDATASAVLEKYVVYLGEGILNFCNSLRPEQIVIGGGLSRQKEYLTDRLNRYIYERKFGLKGSPEVLVKPAMFDNDAGIIGAASLFRDQSSFENTSFPPTKVL